MQHCLQIEAWNHCNAEISAILQWGWRAFLVPCSTSEEPTSAAFFHCRFCDCFHRRNDKVIFHITLFFGSSSQRTFQSSNDPFKLHFKHWGCQRVGTCHHFWSYFMWRIDEFHFRNVNWAIWVQVWTLCIAAFHRGSVFTWLLPVPPALCCFILLPQPCS